MARYGMQADPEARKKYLQEYREKNKEKRKEYAKQLHQRKKDAGLIKKKVRRPSKASVYAEMKDNFCKDCGGVFPPCVLDFDHVKGNKKFNIANSAGYSLDEFIEELRKCEVVCSNCHHIRTQKRRGERKTHAKPSIEKKRLFIINSKNVPCAECEKKFPPVAMQFDHVRGEKRFNLSQGSQYTMEEIIEEIDKCDIICSNCQRIKTQFRMLKK